MDNETQEKQQKIINLRLKLSSDLSDIGDYKVLKTYEARLKGEADPYDTDDLIAKRRAVRDEINKLKKELEGSDADTTLK